METNKTQKQFLAFTLLGILILTFFIFKPFLSTLILAGVCAIVLYPLYAYILTKTKNRDTLSAWITIIFTILCIVVPLSFIGKTLFQQALTLYSSLTEENTRHSIIYSLTDTLSVFSNGIIPGSGDFFTNLSTNIDAYIKQILSWIIDHLGTALSGISKVALSFFIFLISLYYFLKDGKKLIKEIESLSPLNKEDDDTLISSFHAAVNSIVKGNLLIAFIQGVLTTIGFALFGVPNSILWGTITIVASLIPRIGTSIIILPAVAYLFITNNITESLLLFLWGIGVVGVVDNILGPKLIGNKLKLHPLFILLSVLGGMLLFGPIGIFIGPLIISILFAVLSVYKK